MYIHHHGTSSTSVKLVQPVQTTRAWAENCIQLKKKSEEHVRVGIGKCMHGRAKQTSASLKYQIINNVFSPLRKKEPAG